MEIFKKFTFDAAHFLPNAPEGHKCRRLHGHTFTVSIHVAGKADPQSGWILDFADIKQAFAPLMDRFDHHLLNDIPGLEVPTSENMAAYIWRQLKPQLPGLCKVIVQENATCGAVYRGEDEN
jgi:6-pyruvoyltetrahydropterin/6-carboxytetrahydropterin synthase